MSSVTNRPTLNGFGAGAPVELRLRRLLRALALGFAAFVTAGALAAIAAERHHALWGVVDMCVADASHTGFAFPCLRVDLSRGRDLGYAVLRPPVGRPDTILTPTRRSIGLEDSWVRAPEAPNYFDEAWNNRSFVPNGERAVRQPSAMALAVNSRFVRTQDQLHIHMGCLALDRQTQLRRIAAAAPPRMWVQAPQFADGHSAWAYRAGVADFADLAPFKIAAEHFGEGRDGLGGVTLLAAPVAIGAGADILLLAFPTHNPHFYLDTSAEDLIDASCADFAL